MKDVLDVGILRDYESPFQVSSDIVDSILRNKVALKAPFANPNKREHQVFDSLLKRKLQLFANVRSCKSMPGLPTAFDDVDLVVIRENTEGEHCGIEHQASSGQEQVWPLLIG